MFLNLGHSWITCFTVLWNLQLFQIGSSSPFIRLACEIYNTQSLTGKGQFLSSWKVYFRSSIWTIVYYLLIYLYISGWSASSLQCEGTRILFTSQSLVIAVKCFLPLWLEMFLVCCFQWHIECSLFIQRKNSILQTMLSNILSLLFSFPFNILCN